MRFQLSTISTVASISFFFFQVARGGTCTAVKKVDGFWGVDASSVLTTFIRYSCYLTP